MVGGAVDEELEVVWPGVEFSGGCLLEDFSVCDGDGVTGCERRFLDFEDLWGLLPVGLHVVHRVVDHQVQRFCRVGGDVEATFQSVAESQL